MASLTPGRGSEEAREAKKRAIITALQKGHTRTDAAALAGITRETFYAWCRNDLTFSDAVTCAETQATEYYLDCIHAAAKDDPRHAQWFLERRRSNDYARKDTVTVLARLSKELDNLSDADLIALAAGDGSGDQASDGAGEVEG